MDVSRLTFADSWPHSLLSRHHFFFSRKASPSSCNFKICRDMQLLPIYTGPWIVRDFGECGSDYDEDDDDDVEVKICVN